MRNLTAKQANEVYREDETPEREAIRHSVNDKLLALQKSWENPPAA